MLQINLGQYSPLLEKLNEKYIPLKVCPYNIAICLILKAVTIFSIILQINFFGQIQSNT